MITSQVYLAISFSSF